MGGTLFALLFCLFLIGNGCGRKGSDAAPDRPKAESKQPAAGLTTTGTPAQTAQEVSGLIREGDREMDSHHYREAVDAYTRALEITPENVDVRIDMGTCYRKMGRPVKALEAYRKALSYQPDYPNGLANLGVILAYDLQDRAGAVKVWERFLSLYPNHPMAASIRKEVQRIQAGPKADKPS